MSDLTNDELKQNMAVLEAFVTTALGIIIAMSGPDPGKQKAAKTLDLIKEASKRRLIDISSDMPVGEHYLTATSVPGRRQTATFGSPIAASSGEDRSGRRPAVREPTHA